MEQRNELCGVATHKQINVRSLGFGLGIGLSCLATLLVGFGLGRQQKPGNFVMPLAASSADSSDSLAMATGQISEDADGVFFLDFNTGDLQCLVYYPRTGNFGAHFYTNVRKQLGSTGRNSKYVMVTGAMNRPANSGGARPGNSLVYVTDVTTGLFAAYAVPWDRPAETSGRPQIAPLVFVQGGPVRNYQFPAAANEPPQVVDPAKKQ
jgi:hypothetical protein